MRRYSHYILVVITLIGIILLTSSNYAATKKVPEVKNIYKNNLKTLFENNKAIIYGLIIRTFNAKDLNNDGLINSSLGEKPGTFLNAIERLDELEGMGINTLHLLPVLPCGKADALGNAGSVYSPSDFTVLNPKLDEAENDLSVNEEAKKFVNECHKRNIKVMFDIPCCANIDLFEKNPDLFMKNAQGEPLIPCDWKDIRLLNPYSLENKTKLNEKLMEIHKKFVDLCIELGVDGIRADVARTRPPEFWKELIQYARSKDSQFAFLAESFEEEKASTIENIPADNPIELLNSGFDSYYGIFNQFSNWKEARKLTKYVDEEINLLKTLPAGKSLIGSFMTHDIKSPILIGGLNYARLIIGLEVTLPHTNPYFINGIETGAVYNYDFNGKTCSFSDTDAKTYYVHPGQLDIFNYSASPIGKYPELAKYIMNLLTIRKKYEPIITKGSFIPLNAGNKEDKIIAYARVLKDKNLVIIANIDLKQNQTGTLNLSQDKDITLIPVYSSDKDVLNCVTVKNDRIEIRISPGSFNIYEFKGYDFEKISKALNE